MADNKKSFILYCDLIHTVFKLNDAKAGKLFKHILKYVNDENPETKDLIIDITFEPIKQQLKRDLKHWNNVKQVRSDSGKLGGRPKKQIKAKEPNALLEKQTKAKKAVNVNVTVSDSVNDNGTVNVKNIPEFPEFLKYAKENKPKVDEESVKLKYKAWKENDWNDGNDKPIKNWRTKLLNTLQFLKEKRYARTEIKQGADFGKL